ncbi:MAG: hypothetical protein ACLF0P_00025 [Thermoanaerobaculia bacterium]
MKRLLQMASACLCGVLVFVWGYLAHRNRVFPYPQARSLATWAGSVEAPEPERHEVWRDPAALGALEAFPYVDGLPDSEPDLAGVVEHEPDRAKDGVNLYAPRELAEAYLLDMEGRKLWRWFFPRPRWLHVEVFDGSQAYRSEFFARLHAQPPHDHHPGRPHPYGPAPAGRAPLPAPQAR